MARRWGCKVDNPGSVPAGSPQGSRVWLRACPWDAWVTCAQGKQMEAREVETSQAFGTHLTDFSQRKGCIQSHLDVI